MNTIFKKTLVVALTFASMFCFGQNNETYTYNSYAEYDNKTSSWINIKEQKTVLVIKDDQLYRNGQQISSNMLGLDVIYGDNYVEYLFFRNNGTSPFYYRFYKNSKIGVHIYFMGKLQYAYYNQEMILEEVSGQEQKALNYYKNATDFWKKNDINNALEQINLSISSYSNFSDSYFLRGFIYLYGFRNYSNAIEDFTKSIQMNDNYEYGYFYRGIAYRYSQNNISAITDFTKTIDLNKDNTDAYFMRGLIKSDMGDRYGAISDYDEIIKREKLTTPQFYKMSTVYNNKAYCLIEQNKLNEALPYVNKALELDKTEAYIWDTRGELYFKLGEYNKALIDMNKAISIEERDNSFYIRGLTNIKLGKLSDGCKDLSRAGELGKTEAYEAIKLYCK